MDLTNSSRHHHCNPTPPYSTNIHPKLLTYIYLTQKLAQIHKENTAPKRVQKIKKSNTRTILNNNNRKRSNNRKSAKGPANANDKNKMSMTDVSDMLYEFYRANAAAKAPKGVGPQQPQIVMGSGATATAVQYVNQISPTSAETNEPSSIAAIATNGAAFETASKNLQSDEMINNKLAASFHPSIMYTNTNTSVPSTNRTNKSNMPSMTAIPRSVVMPPTNLAFNAESLDIKPIINPATGLVMTPNPSVIQPVPIASTSANSQAAAIAAALLRDGYHSFQQQMRAQELIKFHTGKINKNVKVVEPSTSNILENFLRQQRNSECDNDSDYNDGDDEDDSRYNGFEDIHLMEGSRAHYPNLLQNAMANNSAPGTPASGDYFSDESQKYMSLAAQAQAQAQAYRNLEYSLSDFGSPSPKRSVKMGRKGVRECGSISVYECRHCNKKYRWKSTLRRHENVECGGKQPAHQCPYCNYRSKQRGNLGVHVRKHHSTLPQLTSQRRSKYSIKFGSNPSSASVSDDSNSKLIIDCSK